MSAHDEADEAAVDYASRVRVTSGRPTAVEVAAVTAVVAAALAQLAEEDRRREPGGATRWERSGRGLRRSLARGDWRSFGH